MCSLCVHAEAPWSIRSADSVSVRVALNHAPPYRNLKTTPPSGFYVEVFNALAARLNWTVHYIQVPFRRALYMMKRGDVDVMLGPLRTPEREAFMDYVVAAFPPERKLFLYKQPQNQIRRYQDLLGRKIGVQRGSVYFEPFDSDVTLTKEYTVNYAGALKMLDKDYLDVVIIPEMQSVALQHRLKLNFAVSSYAVAGERSWIVFSLASPLIQRREELVQAMAAFVEEDAYHQLLNRYLGKKEHGNGLPSFIPFTLPDTP